MMQATITSFLFRYWAKLHERPLLLSQLRPMWREVRRFVREEIYGIMAQTPEETDGTAPTL